MKYILVYFVLLLGFIGVFVIGQQKRKHDLIDIFWGIGFILSALVAWLLGPRNTTGTLLLVLVLAWGLRLSLHLARRNTGKPEDFRYQEMRQRWQKGFERKMFLRNYLLQFALNAVVGLPLVYTNLQGSRAPGLLTWLGVAVWIIGFSFEVIGDEQLRRFTLLPQNKGLLMTKGLWSWTRHPNYFGEAVLWWGFWIISVSGDLSRWWMVFSPLLMTILLRFVSGVPLLEKKYQGREDWNLYVQSTSVFFPFPPVGKQASEMRQP